MSKKVPQGQLSWIQPEADQLSLLPFAEKGTTMNEIESTYPLLVAWQSGRLRESWQQEREAMKEQDPKLLDWVLDYEAAAHLSSHLSVQYQDLSCTVKWIAREHQSDPDYSDIWTEFYDLLQDDNLKFYRAELQEISGNRNLMSDEIRYSASLQEE